MWRVADASKVRPGAPCPVFFAMSLARFSNGLARFRKVLVFDVGNCSIFLPEGIRAWRELCLLLADLVIGWRLHLCVPTESEAFLSVDG